VGGVEFHATGADVLKAVARELKVTGDTGLRKELTAGLNRATKAPRAKAKANAAATLPRRGGLAARVAAANLSTRVRTGGDPGVRIVAKSGRQKVDVARIDEGTVRHPTFGRGRWQSQSVTPGWFTKPMRASAPLVRAQLIGVIDAVIRKLGG
jgi:hypothetical protein